MINNNTNLNKNKIKKYTHLKYEDRVIIEHVLKENKVNVLNKFLGKKKKTLNKSERTIRREIKRTTIQQQDSILNLVSVYSSQYYNVQYIKNITNKEIRIKIDSNPQLAKYISYLLSNKYPPYAALELAKRKFNVNFSLQTLYNYINKNIFEFMC